MTQRLKEPQVSAEHTAMRLAEKARMWARAHVALSVVALLVLLGTGGALAATGVILPDSASRAASVAEAAAPPTSGRQKAPGHESTAAGMTGSTAPSSAETATATTPADTTADATPHTTAQAGTTRPTGGVAPASAPGPWRAPVPPAAEVPEFQQPAPPTGPPPPPEYIAPGLTAAITSCTNNHTGSYNVSVRYYYSGGAYMLEGVVHRGDSWSLSYNQLATDNWNGTLSVSGYGYGLPALWDVMGDAPHFPPISTPNAFPTC